MKWTGNTMMNILGHVQIISTVTALVSWQPIEIILSDKSITMVIPNVKAVKTRESYSIGVAPAADHLVKQTMKVPRQNKQADSAGSNYNDRTEVKRNLFFFFFFFFLNKA